MKKLFAIIAVAALTVIGAQAQQATYGAQAITVPTVSGDGGVSNALNLVIDVRKQDKVALSWVTTSTNVTVRIGASVDGLNYSTNYSTLAWTNALANISIPTINVIDTYGLAFLRIDSVLNTGSRNATNTAVSYGIKIP